MVSNSIVVSSHQGKSPTQFFMGVESGKFDVTGLVEKAIDRLPWRDLATLALREHIMEVVRAVDFKPIIEEAVRLYVKQTLEGLDIAGTPCADHVRKLAK